IDTSKLVKKAYNCRCHYILVHAAGHIIHVRRTLPENINSRVKLMKSELDELFNSFRNIKKPQEVKGCNCSFCLSSEEITELLNSDQKLLTYDALYLYIDNVLITIGSPEDFTYLLPAILKIWSEELYKDCDSAFNQRVHGALIRESLEKYLDLDIDEIYPVSARDGFLYKYLPEELRKVVLNFMEQEIFERIGRENSLSIVGRFPSHNWFRVFASYGVLSLDVGRLWERWWSIPTEGHAIALVQYASCLICDKENNPVFAPWDPKLGGGAPLLWNYESFYFGEYWMKENLEFLAKRLTVEYLFERLSDAQKQISNPKKKKISEEVRQILERESQRTELRIIELIELLGNPSTFNGPYEWTI
ncbi:MAG: hypothetical protein AB1489_29945, partial [Acidobacteriota bacterium]